MEAAVSGCVPLRWWSPAGEAVTGALTYEILEHLDARTTQHVRPASGVTRHQCQASLTAAKDQPAARCPCGGARRRNLDLCAGRRRREEQWTSRQGRLRSRLLSKVRFSTRSSSPQYPDSDRNSNSGGAACRFWTA